ncbi:MAG: biopolymer transporter ExbD [Planctomycetota bacterium]|nr:biopolymer transporter ExbD [Planctomycetota bacterium]
MNQQFKVRCFDAKTGTSPELLLMGETEAAVISLAQQAGLLVMAIEAVAPLAAVLVPSAAPVNAPVMVAQVVKAQVVAQPALPPFPAKPASPKVPVAVPLAPIAVSVAPIAVSVAPIAVSVAPIAVSVAPIAVPIARAPTAASVIRPAVPGPKTADLPPTPPKRKGHGENLFPPTGEVIINVVPMLDMTFQLLFFFIITFQAPTGLEAQIPLVLPPPEGQQEAAKDKKDNTDKDIVPTIDSDVIVEVKSLNNPQYPGEMGEVEVSGLAKEIIRPTPGKSLDEGRTEVLARLGETMKQMAQDLKKDKLSLRLKADPGVKWERVIQVADTCRQAKFLGIRFEKPGGS